MNTCTFKNLILLQPTIRYYISVPSLTLLVVDRTTGDMKCKLEKLMHGNKRYRCSDQILCLDLVARSDALFLS